MSFTLRNLPVPVTFGETLYLKDGTIASAESILTYL